MSRIITFLFKPARPLVGCVLLAILRSLTVRLCAAAANIEDAPAHEKARASADQANAVLAMLQECWTKLKPCETEKLMDRATSAGFAATDLARVTKKLDEATSKRGLGVFVHPQILNMFTQREWDVMLCSDPPPLPSELLEAILKRIVILSAVNMRKESSKFLNSFWLYLQGKPHTLNATQKAHLLKHFKEQHRKVTRDMKPTIEYAKIPSAVKLRQTMPLFSAAAYPPAEGLPLN